MPVSGAERSSARALAAVQCSRAASTAQISSPLQRPPAGSPACLQMSGSEKAFFSLSAKAPSSNNKVDVCFFLLPSGRNKNRLSGSGSGSSGGPGVVAHITEDHEGHEHGNWHLDGGHGVNVLGPRGRAKEGVGTICG
mmetsp:Transcript_14319/g.25164  ORF Transcript_14319/g.25164 Transcript_14319/m.25164 type:complete len:138 (-) Transcript_14319:4-417(-)